MKRVYSVTKAYHSTKQKGLKKFESRTTTATIDTGEGAHIHGWGLYLQADEMQNREDYYNMFAGKSNDGFYDVNVEWNGKTFIAESTEDNCNINDYESVHVFNFPNCNFSNGEELCLMLLLQGYSESEVENYLSNMITELEGYTEDDYNDDYFLESLPEVLIHYSEDDFKDALVAIRNTKSFNTETVGDDSEVFEDGTHSQLASQYTVEIPDDMVFIDEDTPIPDWLVDKWGEYCNQNNLKNYSSYNDSVRGFQKAVGYALQNIKGNNDIDYQELASLWLAEHGIDGMTYEGGRDNGCFVIYNCDKLKIIAEY